MLQGSEAVWGRVQLQPGTGSSDSPAQRAATAWRSVQRQPGAACSDSLAQHPVAACQDRPGKAWSHSCGALQLESEDIRLEAECMWLVYDWFMPESSGESDHQPKARVHLKMLATCHQLGVNMCWDWVRG